jgi:hypothetical protein
MGTNRSSSGEATGAGAQQDQDEDTPQNRQPGNNSGFSVGSFNSDQSPIVGVVSKKQVAMFRSYYGIEQYDRALFFAGVPVIAGGIYYPSAFGGMVPGSGLNNSPPVGAPVIPNQGGVPPTQQNLQ